jgi:hypothetical protein
VLLRLDHHHAVVADALVAPGEQPRLQGIRQ